MSNIQNAICPGCGWRGAVKPKLACPHCGWENNAPPWRLLTLRELLCDSEGPYGDVRMDLFLKSVLEEYAAHHNTDNVTQQGA